MDRAKDCRTGRTRGGGLMSDIKLFKIEGGYKIDTDIHKVEDEFEFGPLYHRQIGGLLTFAVDVGQPVTVDH